MTYADDHAANPCNRCQSPPGVRCEHDEPTPAVAPGLDLDAVERAERAITPGPWRMHGYAAEIVDADDETVARLDMRGDRITGGDARGFSDAAGIVALRNAAPALIAEVRALRRHYDAAGPDHNLLALLDLYHEREQAALAKLADAKRLGLEAVGFNLSDPTRHTAQCATHWQFRGRDKKCDCPAAIAAALEAL